MLPALTLKLPPVTLTSPALTNNCPKVPIPAANLRLFDVVTVLIGEVVPTPTCDNITTPCEKAPVAKVLIPLLALIVSTLISAAIRVHSPPIFYYL